MDQMTTLKNVNVLDMRNTPKASIDKIGFIKNVNIMMVSPETAQYLPGIPSRNVNLIAHLPADAELQTVMSQLTVDANFLQGISSPKLLVAMGRVIVEPDVTPEMLDEKLAGLLIMGKIICPESVAGVIHGKAATTMGSTHTYPAGAVLVKAPITLDDAFLNTLDDNTDLVAVSSIRILDEVSTSLIERKIRSLQSFRNIVCRQEYEMTIRPKIVTKPNITVVPTGHRLIEGMLTLDPLTLESLSSEQLFCIGDVLIDQDVTAAALNQGISRIESLGVIVCPAALKDSLRTKCDMLNNRVLLSEGTLWYVDDDRQLLADQFEYLAEPMTIVNRADLSIEQDVSPQMILDRVHKLHNLGEINCHPEHVSAIEARLGLREGDLNVVKEQVQKEEKEEGPVIGNANFMVL